MSKLDEFVRGLMPERSEVDIEEAKTNFKEYLLLVNEIADRLAREGKECGTDENGDFYVLDTRTNERKVCKD
jgi:hypothetical protein